MNAMQRLRLTLLGPLAALAVLAALAYVNQAALDAAQINRFQSYRLAHELRHSSDELTRLARTYCVTGDAAFERAYWHLLDVRNGKAPRPDGRTVPLRTLMERQGFTGVRLMADLAGIERFVLGRHAGIATPAVEETAAE